MQQFLRILSYLRKYKVQAISNMVFNLLTILFSLVSIVMLMPFLQLLFGKIPPVYERPAFSMHPNYIVDFSKYKLSMIIQQEGTEAGLIYICIAVAIIFFFKNLFRFLALYALSPLRNGVVRDIRNDLYNKLLALPLSFYSKEKKGDLIVRMTDDVKEVEVSIMSVLEVTFREPLNIIIFLGAMLMFSVQLTVFVFAMLLVTGFFIGRVGRTLKKQGTAGQEQLGFLISVVDETLNGLRIIHGFNAELFKRKQFSDVNQKHYNISKRIFARKELSSPLTEFLAICVMCLVLWFGGKLVLEHQKIAAEAFITFMVIFSQLIPPAKNFSAAFYNIQKGLASSQRIIEILDAKVDIQESSSATPIKEFNHNIEFRNVQFAYNRIDDKIILNNINLKIEKGKMVALVGQSGAGKTTIADLLPRFYDVTGGGIFIDDKDIREYKLFDLRRLYGIVTQEAILFNDTVYNNITFGVGNATMEDVKKAAEIANAHEFIHGLEHGYDTIIGDKGNKLSGGERQRLTIARAVLKNPPILILDEATSSLDSNSEKLVQDALNKLMKGRTTIVIAHRLATIQYADEIILMQDGNIAERGNHIGLMGHNGLYRKLVELQAF
jgi:subfamily B ATP-binding cassette protein MsbA